MYPVEIINKIKMQDAEAFRELVNMYGKALEGILSQLYLHRQLI